MEHNCAFQDEHNMFRYRAAAIILHNDCVLMVTADNVDYFYSLGGAVHLGETAEEAVIREVFEESGVKCEVDRLLFINENLFIENGLCNHEIALYFLIKPIDQTNLMMQSNSCGFKEYLKWIPISELPNLKAFPTFFKTELINLTTIPKHIITN